MKNGGSGVAVNIIIIIACSGGRRRGGRSRRGVTPSKESII